VCRAVNERRETVLTAEARELLEIIEEAIKAERAAYNRYSRGAERATTEEVRQLFLSLASEERRHRERLITQYEALAGKSWEEWTEAT
jgi:rubrerythrin